MSKNKLEKTITIEGIPYPLHDAGKRFLEQTRRIKIWPIKPGDTVIDVGCGATPFPYANILVDQSAVDHSERHGGEIPLDGRRLVEADIEHGLPFQDKEVDFLYCSHLLEHCDDPIAACKEIVRVAKAGFIETPNIVFELLFGRNDDVHKWIVDYASPENTLCFRKPRKEEREAIAQRQQLGNLPRKLFEDPQASPRLHYDAYWKNQDLFAVSFLWKDEFSFKITK